MPASTYRSTSRPGTTHVQGARCTGPISPMADYRSPTHRARCSHSHRWAYCRRTRLGNVAAAVDCLRCDRHTTGSEPRQAGGRQTSRSVEGHGVGAGDLDHLVRARSRSGRSAAAGPVRGRTCWSRAAGAGPAPVIGAAAAIKITPALFLVWLWTTGRRMAAAVGSATWLAPSLLSRGSGCPPIRAALDRGDLHRHEAQRHARRDRQPVGSGVAVPPHWRGRRFALAHRLGRDLCCRVDRSGMAAAGRVTGDCRSDCRRHRSGDTADRLDSSVGLASPPPRRHLARGPESSR